MIRMPAVRNTSSNEPVSLLSRSRIRARALVGDAEAEIAFLLGDPRPGGVGRAPASQTRRFACAMKNDT
jgi:hypothetical protein